MKAIYALYPNAVTIREEEDGSIEVTDNNGTEIEIDMTQVNAWVDPDAYQQKRLAEYPTWNEQLDNIYHNGIDAWKADIKAIKDKYPKGEAK